MPPVVEAVAAYVAEYVGIVALAAGASTVVTTAIVTLAYYATEAAIYYGISKALTPKASMGSVRSQGTQIMVAGSSESHRIIYGQIQVSGVFYPLGVTGANNEYLHFILVYAAHECDSFGALNIAGEAASVDGSGNVNSGKYSGLMTIKSHIGAWDQTVDTDIQSAFGSTFWPDTCKLRGRAYDYVRIKFDQNVAGAGIPTITRMIKGRKIYDPRDGTQSATDPSTWKWSANAALVNHDWAAGVPYRNGAGNVIRNFGFRASFSEVDSAALVESANICDESITVMAGTEARYEAHGLIQTNATRGDVQDALRSSMVGDVLTIGGLWVIRAGAYRTPDSTGITEDDFRAGISGMQVKPARATTINGVKGTYVSPDNNWQAADAPAFTKRIPAANLVAGDEVMIVVAGSTSWTSIGSADNNVGTTFTATGPGTGTGYAESYIVQDGGDRIWLDIELPFTTSAAMAQRIFKIHLEMARQTIKFTGHFKISALQHQATDVVPVTFARYGFSAKPFRVEGFNPVLETGSGSAPMVGCDLTLVETAASVYDWDPSEQSASDVAPNTTLPDPFSVVAPTSLALAATTFLQTDGSLVPELEITWTAPADQFVLSGGQIRVQYKEHASGTWLDGGLVKGDQTTGLIHSVLLGAAYDVQIRAENQLGAASAWVQSLNFTMSGDTTPPATLAAPTATAKPGFVKITWLRSVSLDTVEYRVYRNAGSDNAGAAVAAGPIAEVSSLEYDDGGVTPGTTYWYYVSAVDASENVGTVSAGASATAALSPVGAAVPGAPTAATRVTPGTDDTYVSGDGTVYSFITLLIPALVSNAVWQNVLYRRTGATDWLIAAQVKNSAGTNVRIDDLSPGVSYDFATESWSGAGGSAVTTATASPFTAPTRVTGPSAPTSVTYVAGNDSSFKNPPAYSGVVLMRSMLVSWTAPTDKQVAYYQWRLVQTDSSGGTIWSSGITNDSFVIVNTGLQLVSYFYVQAVDRSGTAGAWGGGGVQTSTYQQPPAGDLSQQNSTDTKLSGLTVSGSGASSAVKVKAMGPVSVVQTLSGGSATETFNVDISGYAFSAKPKTVVGAPTATNDNQIMWRYDFDDSAQTATTMKIEAFRRDGTALGTGPYRFSLMPMDH